MKKGGTVLKKSKKVAGNVKKAVIKKEKLIERFSCQTRGHERKLEQEKRERRGSIRAN